MASVIIIILVIPCIWNTQLMSHLIAKSSASVDNTFIAWWTVLVIIPWSLCMYETEIAILFLTFTSDIMSIMSWVIEKFL